MEDVLAVHEELKNKGYNITVADARFAKPIDVELLKRLFLDHQVLFIIEEGAAGGFSSHCIKYLSEQDLLGKESKLVKCLTLPDKFQDHASQQEQLNEAKLDFDGIMKQIKDVIEKLKIHSDLEKKIG